jgi:hypothetical protein
MARDKLIAAIIKKFGKEFGGTKALSSTWTQTAKQVVAERAEAARARQEETPPTDEQKRALRGELWPQAKELATAPDLLDRAVQQVQALGVVNERPLIKLVFLTSVSRLLKKPLHLLVRGPSSAGKSYVTDTTLRLTHPDAVKHLTTSGPLSLVYNEAPLSHTVLAIFEATQIQQDQNSTFALLCRSLMSTGELIHETTVEDPDAEYGRRAVKIHREGPLAVIITTTGEIHAENDTRMTSFFVTSSSEQTKAVLGGVADRAAGNVPADPDLSEWHALDQWLACGPQDAVVPFARHIVTLLKNSPVRFRRDIDGLFTTIKASALLHQAQRQHDDQGRVIAAIDDYAPAYEIFSHALAQAAGAEVPETVLKVIEHVASLTSEPEQPARATSTFRRAANMNFANGMPSRDVVLPSRKLARAIGLDPSTTSRAVKQAIEMGYLENGETRARQPARLAVLERPDATAGVGLPTLDELRRAASGCVKSE